ncbi:MAG: hypothetical protein ACPGVN_07550 [Alphaproteobacteria bacterium]
MIRIAALLGFALLGTLVGGAMTINADMTGTNAGVYAAEVD